MSDDLPFFDAAAKGENAVASRELGKPLRVNPCSTQNEVYTDLPHKETPNGNFFADTRLQDETKCFHLIQNAPLNTAISLVPQPTKPKEPHFAEHRVQSARTASHSASSAVLSPIGAIDGKGLRRASGSAALVRSCFVPSGKHRAKNASVFTAVPFKIE